MINLLFLNFSHNHFLKRMTFWTSHWTCACVCEHSASPIAARIDRSENNRLPIAALVTAEGVSQAPSQLSSDVLPHVRATRGAGIVSPSIMHSFCAREEKVRRYWLRSHDRSADERKALPVQTRCISAPTNCVNVSCEESLFWITMLPSCRNNDCSLRKRKERKEAILYRTLAEESRKKVKREPLCVCVYACVWELLYAAIFIIWKSIWYRFFVSRLSAIITRKRIYKD